MPRRTSSVTRSGWVCAYASESVEPQDPPNSCQRSTPRCVRSRSMSATRCQVVLASRLACGSERPQPRWSNSTMRERAGSPVHDQRRLAVGVAALLEVELVSPADLEPLLAIGLDRRIETEPLTCR